MEPTGTHGQELEALHPSSYGWALHCCGRDPAQAEEVLQSAYLKILDGRARFTGGTATFKTWFFSVVRRTAAEERRRSRFRARLLRAAGQFVGELGATAARDPGGPASPRDAAQCSQVEGLLQPLLEALSPRQRDVLHLVFYQHLSLDEAASAMGVSPGAARKHYDRAKRRLRREIEGSPALYETGWIRPRA